jgi:hypothetical protein
MMNSLRFHLTWLASVSHNFLFRRLLSFIFAINLVVIILDRDPLWNSFLGHVNALIGLLTLILRLFQLRTGLSLRLSPLYSRYFQILLLFTYVAPDGRETLIEIVSVLLYP